LKKKNNILIVGGTGFIGYHLANKCIQKNWKVTSVSAHQPKKKRFNKKIEYLICDITKKNDIKKKIGDNFDYLVNLGGYVDHSNKKKTYQSHYIGVKNLAKFFLFKNLKSFVQLGSGGEYADCESPHKETNKGSPVSTYYRSKLLATLHLKKLFQKKKFPATILRLYQAYGPRQDVNRLIPIVIKNCLQNKKFDCSEGKQFRDFVYIDDVVNIILKTLKNKNSKGKIFNVGSGKPIKVKKLIETINNKIKKGYPQYGKIKLRKDEKIKVFPSINRSKKILKWQPKISIQSGLTKTIQYYKKND
jgi:nucleoside-diphosphate-sugar epimerase